MQHLKHATVWAEAVVAVALLRPAAIAAEASRTGMIPVAVDAGQYAEFMAGEIQDERDLADVVEIQRRWFNRITPPGFSWVQPMFPSVAPFDADGFSESFLDGLLGEDRNSVAVYPLSLALDPKTRETLVHDAEGKLIAVLPSDGVSRAWPEDGDPARVVLQLDLLPSEDVEPYLYVEGRIAESTKARVAKPERSEGMVLRSLGAGEFGFAGAHRLTNGQMRLTATNGTDVAEIYSYTVWHTSTVVVTVWTNEYDEVVTSTNLVWDPVSPPYAGIESAWACQTTNLVLAGGVGTWDDADVSTNARVRFYAAAKRIDSDEDGLTDGAEIFRHRTDPGLADTDGDGIPDGAEIELGLDPLDPTDAAEDPDGDGFSNLLEYQLGSPLDNPAWNGEQLVYRLMHANTNHSLRVEVADSENCGGTGLTQYVTASLSVPDLLDCGYFLDITVTGNVEDHMSQYDHVYVRALDEKFYFGGDQNYVACSFVAKTGTLNHLVLPNSQIILIYDTVSFKHHVDGYAAITDATLTDVLKVDMAARRPCTEGSEFDNPFDEHVIPEDTEESPGAGIRVNGDGNEGANENDLIKVELKVDPYPTPSGLTYVLKRQNSNIKVWDSQTMGTAILDSGTEAAITFSAATKTVWVENPSGGSADLELIARSGTTDICSDKVHFYPFTAIIIAFGGNATTGQDPSDPADQNHGAFVIGTNLYHQGYDVHMYNEADRDDANDEVDSAIDDRSITQVGIVGYSQGGDAVFDVATHLVARTGVVKFTVYIDAVESPFIPGISGPQDDRPTNTVFHANYYQLTPHGILGLHGASIVNPPGANFETNLTATGVTHLNIDDLAVVRSEIANQVKTHISTP